MSVLLDQLHSDVQPVLESVRACAWREALPLYLVGGMVRDLYLKKPNLDVDFLVEGSGIDLAKQFAKTHASKVQAYYKFRTATVAYRGHRVDFASARRETYPEPGSYPRVSPGSLEEDLKRRDFTINAMALSLNKGDYGALIDPYGGHGDLKEKKIHILHDESFRDDPTRILRGIRFEQRLGFSFSTKTLKLLKAALENGALGTVSAYRLKQEREKILREADPEACFNRLRQLGGSAIMNAF